jgi:hypothetical protein
MVSRCDTEVRVEAPRQEEAVDLIHTLLLGLYTEGMSPTLVPFCTTHSINEYSGINARDSSSLRTDLPDELQRGITSDSGTLEAWPVHLSFTCYLLPDRFRLAPEVFRRAAEKAVKWQELEASAPALRVLRDAAQSAPLLSSRDQSLLHTWCALEALFPRVSTEVSFRVSLYLAQLSRESPRAEVFEAARTAYGVRSRVAHGSTRGATHEQWLSSWELLMNTTNAIIGRGGLPDEDTLLKELL